MRAQVMGAFRILALLTTAYGCSSERAAPDWVLEPGVRAGAIDLGSSEADLVATYGEGNVKRESIALGEGFEEPGTVLFGNDAARRIEIRWLDTVAFRDPRLVRIEGRSSRWHTPGGITLGLTLRDLETRNGKEFKLGGWGWDYGGSVYSWNGGKLDSEIEVPAWGRVILGIGVTPTDEEYSQVRGDQEFLSTHPVMQKINPYVGYIQVSLNGS